MKFHFFDMAKKSNSMSFLKKINFLIHYNKKKLILNSLLQMSLFDDIYE